MDKMLAITLLLLLKLLENNERYHPPNNRALLSSSTNRIAQQRVREQYTEGRTSPTALARRRPEYYGHEPAAVQQRRCAQLSYSLAVSAAVLLTRLNKKKKLAITVLLLLKLL